MVLEGVARLNLVLPEVITSGQLAIPERVIMSGSHNLISTIDYINQTLGQGGFLASWDQVKAHNRASTIYMDLVLEAMKFPLVFRDWVRMLHQGASTRLLAGASGITRAINVTFSFRQGDPAASPLYAIQQEPFLLRVKALCSGIRIGPSINSHRQVDEAFCDDETIIGTDLTDVIKFNDTMKKFESQSSAMLSRSKKSKIMYLGSWKGREDSPFAWLKVVEEVKVFGLVLTPKYSSTLRRTWEEVLNGFRKTVYSWSDRGLDSMFKKAEVFLTFAHSKLWYICQVLPLPNTIANKVESMKSSFLFRGKPERLRIEELYNPASKGGLGLTDIRTKGDALFLKQLARMLIRKEEDAYKHLCYWLGHHLQHQLPAMKDTAPVPRRPPPAFHQHALTLLLEGLRWFGLEPGKLEKITAKNLYKEYTSHLPAPKITEKFLHVNFPSDVWPRLSYSELTAKPRQAVFDAIHGLTRNRARLHQQGRAGDPWCQLCPRMIPLQPAVSDLEHIFCSCVMVKEAWQYVRDLVFQHQQDRQGNSDTNLVRFLFLGGNLDAEVVWLMATYKEMVQEVCLARGAKLLPRALKGRLSERLNMSQ